MITVNAPRGETVIGNPQMFMVRPMECRDGDVLIDEEAGSLTVGKVEALCIPGESTIYRVCDRYDSRVGHWYERWERICVLRGPHQHTTTRCL